MSSVKSEINKLQKPPVQTTITLPEEYIEYLRKIGNGVISKGIKILVEFHEDA